jgi:hypothetical protein
VNNRTVSDRDAITDSAWIAGIGMQTSQILDVGAITDLDTLDIPSDYGAEKDRGSLTDRNITSDGCICSDKGVATNQFFTMRKIHKLRIMYCDGIAIDRLVPIMTSLRSCRPKGSTKQS